MHQKQTFLRLLWNVPDNFNLIMAFCSIASVVLSFTINLETKESM